MVAIDASILLLLFFPDTPGPKDDAGKPVRRAAKRVTYLVEKLEKMGTRLAVPTPVLSELIVRAGPEEANAVVERLNQELVFSVESFDQRAAIELAMMVKNEGPKSAKAMKEDPNATWAKLKFDRQVIAICKVLGVTALYSDDNLMRAVATREKIPVFGVKDLDLPPNDEQTDLTEELEEQERAKVEPPKTEPPRLAPAKTEADGGTLSAG